MYAQMKLHCFGRGHGSQGATLPAGMKIPTAKDLEAAKAQAAAAKARLAKGEFKDDLDRNAAQDDATNAPLMVAALKRIVPWLEGPDGQRSMAKWVEKGAVGARPPISRKPEDVTEELKAERKRVALVVAHLAKLKVKRDEYIERKAVVQVASYNDHIAGIEAALGIEGEDDDS